MATAARVLWTNKIKKKAKTYADGFLLVTAAGGAFLYDEGGKELAAAESKLPYGLAAELSAAEDLACFAGFLVQGDAPCSVAEVYEARGARAPAAAAAAAGAAAPRMAGGTNKSRNACSDWSRAGPAAAAAAAAPFIASRPGGPPKHSFTNSSEVLRGQTAAGLTPLPHQTKQQQQQQAPPQLQVPRVARRRSGKGLARPAHQQDATPSAQPQQRQQPFCAGDAAAALHASSSHAPQLYAPPPPAAAADAAPGRARPLREGFNAAAVPGAWFELGEAGEPELGCDAAGNSDDAVLQLLQSITPAGCDIWGGNSTINGLAGQQQQQQQVRWPPPMMPQVEQQRLRSTLQQPPPQQTANDWGLDASASGTHQQQQQHEAHQLGQTQPQHGAAQRWQQQQQPSWQEPQQQPSWHEQLQQQQPSWRSEPHGQQHQWQQQHPQGTGDGAQATAAARQAWAAPAGNHSNHGSGSNTSSWAARPVLQPVQDNCQQPWQQQQHAHDKPPAQQGAWSAGTAAPAPAPAPAPSAVSKRQGSFSAPRLAAGSPAAGVPLPGRQPQLQQQRGGSSASQGGGYSFPGPAAALAAPQRQVAIPDGFSSAAEYSQLLRAAVTEEVNLALFAHARSFYTTAQQATAAAAAGGGGRGGAGGRGGGGRGAAGFSTAGGRGMPQQQQQQAGGTLLSQLQAACARSGLRYHPSSSLTVYYNDPNSNASRDWGAGSSKARKRGRDRQAADQDAGADGDDDEQQAAAAKPISMYLTLPGKLDRRQYRKHDLWVLSSDALLGATAASSSGLVDRTRQPWTLLARSCWHGPDRDGKMEVELLPGQGQELLPPGHKWQRSQSVSALQGPDVATDVQMAEFVGGSGSMQGWPLVSALLQPWAGAPVTGAADGAPPPAAADGAPQPASGCEAVGQQQLSPATAAAAADDADDGSPLLEDACSSPDGSRDRGSSQPSASLSGKKRRSPSHTAAADAGSPTLPAAPPSAPPAALSDSDSDFEQVGRRKRRQLASAAAAAAAVPSGSEGSDWEVSDLDLEEGGAATPTRAGPGCHSVEDDAPEQQPAEAADAAEAVPSLQAAVAELAARVVAQLGLNAGQAAVVGHVADWLPQLMEDLAARQHKGPGSRRGRGQVLAKPAVATPAAGGSSNSSADGATTGASSSSKPPVCLIHGPFGSGKSSLLVAVIHLLTGLPQLLAEKQQALDSSKPGARKRRSTAAAAAAAAGGDAAAHTQQPPLLTPRVLVAAHTNVAVDRVLLGLLDSGFSSMLRIGSLPRIAKRLLRVSLHSADDSRDSLAQLQSMLQNAAGDEAAMIRAEIVELQAGAERRRRRALSTASVVGITCCSALQSTLDGQVFDVVLLDEASQMTEPTSLIPLLRAKPRFLIAAGDPCQLPPVVCSPTGVSPLQPAAAPAPAGACSGNGSPQTRYGLLRPLFVRLTHLGHVAHLLTHQYRCHPTLSVLSNKHFYNGRLVDGVSAAQRAGLIPGLPPLLLCDVAGGTSQAAAGGGRSSINRAEAQLVAQLVVRLLGAAAAAADNGGGGAGSGGSREKQAEDDDEEEPQCGDGDGSSSSRPAVHAHQLGVICFFRAQAALIKQLLAAEASCPAAVDVQVATVDSFQGAEKEVVLLATTTSNPRSEFCSDGARLNVALTRARRHLVVLGASGVLQQAPSGLLRELVQTCRGGQHSGAGYSSGASLLSLLAQQQLVEKQQEASRLRLV